MYGKLSYFTTANGIILSSYILLFNFQIVLIHISLHKDVCLYSKVCGTLNVSQTEANAVITLFKMCPVSLLSTALIEVFTLIDPHLFYQ